jgi:hypothetical protein
VRPLDGITVLALEQVIAGPFATRQLAELGARVIKIERPAGGDPARVYDKTVKGLSSHFVWVNRSKESLALDVKRPEAKEILSRLLAKADVFLHNLAPGAVDRLGLAATQVRAKHPRLIWCQISGYGPAGPYAAKKAYDMAGLRPQDVNFAEVHDVRLPTYHRANRRNTAPHRDLGARSGPGHPQLGMAAASTCRSSLSGRSSPSMMGSYPWTRQSLIAAFIRSSVGPDRPEYEPRGCPRKMASF